MNNRHAPRVSKIHPTNKRLLEGIRSALKGIAQSLDDADTIKTLGTVDLMLSELSLRDNAASLSQSYVEIMSILHMAKPELAHCGHENAAEQVAIIDTLPEILPDSLHYELASQQLEAGMRAVEQVVHALHPCETEAARTIVSRAIEIERRLQQPLENLGGGDVDIVEPAAWRYTRDRLQQYLSAKLPEKEPKITRFNRLVGGYQKVTLLFDVDYADGTSESLVLRGEKDDAFVAFDGGKISNEFGILASVYAAGLPIAEPLWLEESPDAFGNTFMIVRKAPGENYGSATQQRDIPESVLKSFMTVLAGIHNAPLDQGINDTVLGKWLGYSTLAENTRANIDLWRFQPFMADANASPGLTRVYDWLVDNIPTDEAPPSLVHVDYGPHNVLVDGDHVSAVLDWEASRLGDPAEDIAFVLMCLGDKINRETALKWYYQAGGRPISDYRIRYFDVFNIIKLYVAGLSSSELFQRDPKAEIAWCEMGLVYRGLDSQVQAKIQAAESVKR